MKKNLNEEISRIKSIMGCCKGKINEDDSQAMAMLQQETQEFNEKADEDLTPEEYMQVSCMDENDENVTLPDNTVEEDKQKVMALKEKMKTASLSELIQLKKQFKELKKSQQNEQILSIPVGVAALGAHNAVFLGIAMSGTAAFACALGLGGLLLFLLGRLLFPRNKTKNVWCNKPDRY